MIRNRRALYQSCDQVHRAIFFFRRIAIFFLSSRADELSRRKVPGSFDQKIVRVHSSCSVIDERIISPFFPTRAQAPVRRV